MVNKNDDNNSQDIFFEPLKVTEPIFRPMDDQNATYKVDDNDGSALEPIMVDDDEENIVPDKMVNTDDTLKQFSNVEPVYEDSVINNVSISEDSGLINSKPISQTISAEPNLSDNRFIGQAGGLSLEQQVLPSDNVNDMYTMGAEGQKPKYGRTEEEIKAQQDELNSKSSLRLLIIISVFVFAVIIFLPQIASMIAKLMSIFK
ncbi:MAG: hypothetical protein RR847_00630 [Bacilli bacterium]